MKTSHQLKKIYSLLYKNYGPQGWWPVSTRKQVSGYYPGDYTRPINNSQVFEIMLGAILTQNTSWKNVIIALQNLHTAGYFSFKLLQEINISELAVLIKSSGYYNQKAIKIKNLLVFLDQNSFSSLKKLPASVLREKLLQIKGVGPETADSIILYAFKKPVFVVDAYTRRIFSRLGLCSSNILYDELQGFFVDNLKPDPILFNEYHALLVIHAKNHCKTKPVCKDCYLKVLCNYK